MKVNELLESVEKQITEEKISLIKFMLEEKLRNLKSAEKTLKEIKDDYEEFLTKDINEIETEDYEY